MCICFRGRRLKELVEDRGQEVQLQDKEGEMTGCPFYSTVPVSLHQSSSIQQHVYLRFSCPVSLSRSTHMPVYPSLFNSLSLTMFTCLSFPISASLHSAACLSLYSTACLSFSVCVCFAIHMSVSLLPLHTCHVCSCVSLHSTSVSLLPFCSPPKTCRPSQQAHTHTCTPTPEQADGLE